MRKSLPATWRVNNFTSTSTCLFKKTLLGNFQLLIVLAIGFFISVQTNGQSGYGTVPTDPIPIGGLRIDGFLQRQGTAGDWLAASGGSAAGTYLFNNDGTKAAPFTA